MMSNNYILYLTILLAAFAVTYGNASDFFMEEPCGRVGGQCIKKDECSVEIQSKYLGLCPAQRSKGAECCHGYSTKEHRCEKLGGSCFPADTPCGNTPLKITQATDCPANEICCALV